MPTSTAKHLRGWRPRQTSFGISCQVIILFNGLSRDIYMRLVRTPTADRGIKNQTSPVGAAQHCPHPPQSISEVVASPPNLIRYFLLGHNPFSGLIPGHIHAVGEDTNRGQGNQKPNKPRRGDTTIPISTAKHLRGWRPRQTSFGISCWVIILFSGLSLDIYMRLMRTPTADRER